MDGKPYAQRDHGGTGLISTAITRLLIERGYDVIVYNRGTSAPQIPRGVKRILGDRTNHVAFEVQMAEANRFDCVVDMVCYSPADAESTVCSFRGRTNQYIFCSTVDVYTKPARNYPIREDWERQPAKSFPYAWNKAACENIFLESYHRGCLLLTIIWPAYTYGKGRGPIHTKHTTWIVSASESQSSCTATGHLYGWRVTETT